MPCCHPLRNNQQADWRAPEGQLPPVGQAPEHPRTWLVFSDQHVYIDKVLDEVGRQGR